MLDRRIELTADGSKTIFVPQLDENYHSIHGALQESEHVFINAGLQYLNDQNRTKINLFEMGFGTGLNAYLTYIYAEAHKFSVNYIGLEKYPIESNLFLQLDYEALIDKVYNYSDPSTSMNFIDLHQLEWERPHKVSDFFTIEKINKDLHHFETKEIDLIYFDAFAPSAQPDLWKHEIFSKLFSFLNDKGTLVTYCAKGIVKRALKQVGFKVESLVGPPGKREMIRAIKYV